MLQKDGFWHLVEVRKSRKQNVGKTVNWTEKCIVMSASVFLLENCIQYILRHIAELYYLCFQYYHRRACSQCNSVPKDPSVCLLCGTIVCLREPCCKQQDVCECVQHATDCGAGTAIFLVVNASTVIVIRGPRVCLWGCIHLDSFGEEDRELK